MARGERYCHEGVFGGIDLGLASLRQPMSSQMFHVELQGEASETFHVKRRLDR